MTVSREVFDEMRRSRDHWRNEAAKYKAELADAMRVLGEERRSRALAEQRRARTSEIDRVFGGR